jgi:hypothetical protein
MLFSELEPGVISPGNVRAVRSSDEIWHDMDPDMADDWMGYVGVDDALRWWPVAMRLSAQNSHGSAGAVWTNHLELFDDEMGGPVGTSEGGDDLDPFAVDHGIDEFRVLFAEVDQELLPTSRAVEIASYRAAPGLGVVWDDTMYDGEPSVVGLDTSHFNTAVVEVSDGLYVVVWVEHEYGELMLDIDNLYTPVAGEFGTVKAQAIVCE